MTDAPLHFDVAKKRAKSAPPIRFAIEGAPHVYSFKPKKTASMLMPMLVAEDGADLDVVAMRSAWKWLISGLPKKDVDILNKRLADDNDDFDWEELQTLIQTLQEHVTGNPTG